MDKKRPRQANDPMISPTNPMGSLSYSQNSHRTHKHYDWLDPNAPKPKGSNNDILPQPVAHRPGVADHKQKRRKQTVKNRHPVRRIIKRIFLILLALLIVGGGWLGWKFYQNVYRVTGNNNPFSVFSSTPLRVTDGRTNILLAGYSVDDPGHSGAALTDSIMVVSVDQNTNRAALISIPRDLWVEVPDYGYSKINAAFPYVSEDSSDPDGGIDDGMSALSDIVSDIVGLELHYYALINYSAFRDAVNAIGGITVDLTSDDNPYGLYDPYANLKLPNGVVDLDGQTALDLARARGDGPGAYGFPRSDFNRTEHQRIMLIALKDKATGSGVLSNPLKVAELTDAVGNNVRTDIQASEIQTAAKLVLSIDTENIVSAGLNNVNEKNLLRSYLAPGGQSALIPAAGVDNYETIQEEIQLFLNPPPPETTEPDTLTTDETQ